MDIGPKKADEDTTRKLFKITTYNVNGIKKRIDELKSYVEISKPDILCIQETKMNMEKDDIENFKVNGYFGYFYTSEKPGYAGTSIYSRIKPISVEKVEIETLTGEGKNEGRCIVMEFNNFYLINTYVINAGDKLQRLDYKVYTWNATLQKHIEELRKKKPIIWTGDLNVAHKEIDFWNSAREDKTKKYSAGYTPREREWFDNFINTGYVDIYRKLNPDKVEYTFFNYRGNAKAQNHGWRIDYFVVHKDDYDKLGVNDCKVEGGYDGKSDHLPLSLYLDHERALSAEDAIISKPGCESLNTGNQKNTTGKKEKSVQGSVEKFVSKK